MEKKSVQPEKFFISEEEKTLNWEDVQKSFEKIHIVDAVLVVVDCEKGFDNQD